MVMATALLFFSIVTPPALQKRTTPALHEETCKDHLQRIRTGLMEVSLKHAELKVDPQYYRQRAEAVLATEGLDPSYETCRKKNLQELDVVLALWEMEYLTDMMNQELKGKQ